MKKHALITLATLSIALFTQCKNNSDSRYENNPSDAPEPVTASNHAGKKLMETKCYVCHSPTTPAENTIAPPMVAIKSHYIKHTTSKEDFTNALWKFVEKPAPEKAIMHGAVKRYGLMPYQPFSKSDIASIAAYMYDYKIAEPEWFQQHLKDEDHGNVVYNNKGRDGKEFAFAKAEQSTDPGLQYALNAKAELGKNLMGAIQKKGTPEAVVFCNKRAYPITDSVATSHRATIKRASDRPRNPKNQATKKELDAIARFKKAIAANQEYEPITEVVNNKTTLYYPITTNSMCLQCHGKPAADIKPAVLTAITQLYPQDMAVGYGVNEVRGVWSITYKQ